MATELQPLKTQVLPLPNNPGWTPDTIIYYLEGKLLADVSALDRRYNDALLALDKRFSERHDSSQIQIRDRFEAAQTAISAALAAMNTAVNKAEVAAEKRFESVNEFRATLSEQQSTLIPRLEVNETLKAINDKITASLLRLDQVERGMNERMSHIDNNILEARSKGAGANQLWMVIIGVLGVAGVIISILGIFMKGGIK